MRKLMYAVIPVLSLCCLTAVANDAKVPSPVPVPAALEQTKEEAAPEVGFRFDFGKAVMIDGIPKGWTYKGKAFTNDVKYGLVEDPELKTKVLKIVSDKASGVLLYDLKNVDLNKYPVMRWKWKVELLPAGADANIKQKDDQGIAIYVGYGRFSQESVSYTWQTETKKGTKGFSTYNSLVDVHWFTLQDKNTEMNKWVTEEVNVKNDILKEMKLKKLPSGLAISLSSNSQYTGTKAISYIDYIEFVAEK